MPTDYLHEMSAHVFSREKIGKILQSVVFCSPSILRIKKFRFEKKIFGVHIYSALRSDNFLITSREIAMPTSLLQQYMYPIFFLC